MALKIAKKFLHHNKPLIIAPITRRFASSDGSKHSSDPITHTGQQWEDDDYRLVRFVDKKKKVNASWAAKLINEVPPSSTKSRVVSCDGGGGPTGHPKVYINLDKPGNHSCGYCGLRFEKHDSH